MTAEIHLFGNVRVSASGLRPSPIASGLQPLMVYLCLDDLRARNRHVTLAALLPDVDPKHARRRLNTWMWRLRKVLTPFVGESAPITSDASGMLQLGPEVDSADAHRIASLEQHTVATMAGNSTSELLDLESAAGLQFDEFAQGCHDEWVVVRREASRLHALRVLSALADEWVRRGETGRAFVVSETLVQRDPLREDAHRRIMRLYAAQGRRRQALRQYKICCDVLRDELATGPLPETAALAAAIEAGAVPIARPTAMTTGTALSATDPAVSPVEAAIEACQAAVRALVAARDQAKLDGIGHDLIDLRPSQPTPSPPTNSRRPVSP